MPNNKFHLSIKDISPNESIPSKFAYCVPEGSNKTIAGDNNIPHISWSNPPKGVKSFALVMVDPDVPQDFSPANKEDEVIAKDVPRRNFYHWLVVDIPPSVSQINDDAIGVIGQNDYGVENLGYDGPCPPWNDERVHHYHFIIYALNVESLHLGKGFTGTILEKALKPELLWLRMK